MKQLDVSPLHGSKEFSFTFPSIYPVESDRDTNWVVLGVGLDAEATKRKIPTGTEQRSSIPLSATLLAKLLRL